LNLENWKKNRFQKPFAFNCNLCRYRYVSSLRLLLAAVGLCTLNHVDP
jgi:hypothetical protein